MGLYREGLMDAIVALATPKGIGAIGVIRVSGVNAWEIVNELFRSKDLLKQASHTLHFGLLRKGEDILDEVVLALYKNPHSYTGEDVVEINCHGSVYIQNRILETLLEQGCRLARPGEFTQRAFLNGKLDLTQAEAVSDLIASNTEASKNNALRNIRGGFKSDLSLLREKLVYFSAMIELELDFATEDVEFADRSDLKKVVNELVIKTNRLAASFKLGNVIKNGVQVAIIGKPNTGKSTLLNSLLNENRAIVSEIAGTTRDTIEEVLNIDGVLFRLIDTAGIRVSTESSIEDIGIQKSFEKMRSADLVVYLFDLNTTSIAELESVVADFEKEGIKYLLVGNKVDISKPEQLTSFKQFENLLFISAKQNVHLEELKKELVKQVVEGEINTESTIVTNVRHYDALNQLSKVLAEIEKGLDDQLSGDLLSLDIKKCLYYLGLITGEITNEEQLDLIFSSFCIGK